MTESLLRFFPHRMKRMSVDDIHAMGSVVYFIFAEDELLYVGQSRNFKHRMKMHRARFDEEAELTNDLRLKNLSLVGIPVPSEQLNEVEYYYIQKFLPQYNKDYLPEAVAEAYRAVRIAKMELVLAQIELEEAMLEYHVKSQPSVKRRRNNNGRLGKARTRIDVTGGWCPEGRKI